MTVTITINGEDAGHALRELGGLANGLLPPNVGIPAPRQQAAADAGAAEGAFASAPVEATKTTRTRKKADDKPAISTNPEDRRPPEDDEATQAQDAADEQAEVEAAREPEKPLTVEDVKAAVGEYVTKFGMAETQQDGVKIFADALGKPPAGEPFWKMSLLASASQEQLQKAIVAWKTAASAQTRYVAKE